MADRPLPFPERSLLSLRTLPQADWERLLVTYFTAMFNLRFRPWQAADPKSAAYMGIGAFNMVRAERYRAMGGHTALPLEVTDDMKLGKLMKAHGARLGVVSGSDWVAVRWVIGLHGFVDGLAKNCFAGFNFRLDTVGQSLLAILLTQVLPPLGLLAGGRTALVAALTFAARIDLGDFSVAKKYIHLGIDLVGGIDDATALDEECPMRAMSSLVDAPVAAARVLLVWRRSWKCRCVTPVLTLASAHRRFQRRRESGSPSASVNNSAAGSGAVQVSR